MTALSELQRDIARLRRDLANVQREARENAITIAAAVRRGRLNLVAQEVQSGFDRLRPDVSPQLWEPRSGQPTDPILGGSLIDRLRAGDRVAESMGNVGIYVGRSNLLPDGPLDSARNAGFFPLAPSAAGRATQDFWGQATLTSGTNPTGNFWSFDLRSKEDLPFNSGALYFVVEGIGGAIDLEQRFYGPGIGGAGHVIAAHELMERPYVVGSCGVHLEHLTDVAFTTTDLTLELVKNIAGSPVVLASESFAVRDLELGGHFRLYVAALTGGSLVAGNTIALRLKMHTVTSAGGGEIHVAIFEPQLHFALSPDPQSFVPALAGWDPAYVDGRASWLAGTKLVEGRQISNPVNWYELDADGTGRWGPGPTALDLRQRRSGTKAMTIDDGAGGAATLNVLGELQDDGSPVLKQADGYVLKSVQVKTATGTYTTPAGIRAIVVECIGAGGGGGGADGDTGLAGFAGGGGAGSFGRKLIIAPAAIYDVTVPAGGAGGAAGNNAGTGGASTIFAAAGGAAILTAGGGGAGSGSGVAGSGVLTVAGGTGGTVAVGGDINTQGSSGGAGIRLSATVGVSGQGGASHYSGQAPGRVAASVGVIGQQYGGGGSGAAAIGVTDQAGGAGREGVIIVYEYA